MMIFTVLAPDRPGKREAFYPSHHLSPDGLTVLPSWFSAAHTTWKHLHKWRLQARRAFANAASASSSSEELWHAQRGCGGRGRDWSSLAGPLAGIRAVAEDLTVSGPWFAAANPASPVLPGDSVQRRLSAVAAGRGAPPNRTRSEPGIWSRGSRSCRGNSRALERDRQQRRAALHRAPGHGGRRAPTLDNAMRLYELWVNCAEESYAATVRKDDFSHLQAELANTSAALLVEQRRHAETLVRAFGLPTRNEVDALYAQLKDLRRQLAELTMRRAPRQRAEAARGAAGGDKRRARRRKPRA